MDFLNYFLKNLELLDYSIISYLLFLHSLNNYLIASNIKIVNDKNEEKQIKNNLEFKYIFFLFSSYLGGAFLAFILNSILIILIFFLIFPVLLYFIFINRFKHHKLSQGISYFVNQSYFGFPSALLTITFYILLITLVFPANPTIGISLLILFLIPRTILTILTPNFYRKRKKLIFNSSVQFLLTILNSASIILIIIFSFSFSIQYKSDYAKKINQDIGLTSIQKNITDFDNSINELSTSLTTLSIAQENAHNKLDSLQILFQNINQNFQDIALTKIKLEEQINYLQNKSEEEIKKDAIYKTLSEIINKNQYLTLIISLIIGIITGLIANYLFNKFRNVNGNMNINNNQLI